MVAWCALGITSTCVGACGLMSRKASTRSVRCTTSAGTSPATMRQKRQSVTPADPRPATPTGRARPISLSSQAARRRRRGVGSCGVGEAHVSSAMTKDSAGGAASGPPRGSLQGLSMRSALVWGAVALVGAICWGVLAIARGETISALWLLFAALCSYAIAYRFYARFIAYRALRVDDTRATPAERLHNGIDFDVTDRRVVFGPHFAAIPAAAPPVHPGVAAPEGLPPRPLLISGRG